MRTATTCCFFAVILLSACTSLMQKGGEFLEGSAFSEKTVAIYRAGGIEVKELRLEGGEEILEISNAADPALVLRTSTPAADGTFHLTEARILSTHVNGWNELTIQLLGSGSFSGAVLRLEENVERINISGGSIRLKGNRVTGDTALSLLRNRRERLTALSEWMLEKQEHAVFADEGEFYRYWQRILFPEIVSQKHRPPEYSENGAEWNRADSVRWNTTYTESVYPEELWESRNTGTLLRDWEEALSWIYIEHSWKTIIDSFSEITLSRIK